jgi:hypothetical protein
MNTPKNDKRRLEMKYKAISCLVALMLCAGIFYAPAAASVSENMVVSASWLDGELLRVDITDKDGVKSSMAIRMDDYISETDSEFITIQVMDLEGSNAGVIEVKNPYYKPPAVTGSKQTGQNTGGTASPDSTGQTP